MTIFEESVVPLIIDGLDVKPDAKYVFAANSFEGKNAGVKRFIQGSDKGSCLQAIESCAKAFPEWRNTESTVKRKLFLRLAEVRIQLFSNICR